MPQQAFSDYVADVLHDTRFGNGAEDCITPVGNVIMSTRLTGGVLNTIADDDGISFEGAFYLGDYLLHLTLNDER